jgi:ATP-binding cassette subfamily B multidrug efflux pump
VILQNYFRILVPPQFRKAFDLASVCLQEYKALEDPEEKEILLNYISLNLWDYAWMVLLFAAIMGVFMYLMRQTVIVVSRLIEKDLRNEIFEHYQSLDASFYNDNATGDLMSRITEDVSKVRMYLGPGLLYCVNLVTLFVLAIYYMYQVNPTLTLYSLAPLPVLSLSIYYVSSLINRRSTVIQQQLAKLNVIAQEVFSGIRVVKSYAKEDQFREFFSAETEQYKQDSMSLAKVNAFFHPLMLLLVSFSVLLVVIVGGQEVAKGNITHGNIAEFIIYVNMLTWPFTAVGWIVSIVQQAAASQKRILEYMQSQPLITNPSTEKLEIEGVLTFDNVSYTYPSAEEPSLRNLTFTVNAGENLGIIGRTASGKSTMAELLLRLMDPSAGSIKLDGKDLREVNLDILRQRIGYVPQDAFLFSDSIAQNVAFGESSLDIDRVKYITAKAAVHDDIMGLPQQYETLVGERGVTLSGGQKQRIALARALIKNPDIIILDDCLSAVDTTTEQTILGYLKEALDDKTSIIITHRIYRHLTFDKVIVLEDGEIIEMGTPQELLDQKGYYFDILNKQLKEEAEPETAL